MFNKEIGIGYFSYGMFVINKDDMLNGKTENIRVVYMPFVDVIPFVTYTMGNLTEAEKASVLEKWPTGGFVLNRKTFGDIIGAPVGLQYDRYDNDYTRLEQNYINYFNDFVESTLIKSIEGMLVIIADNAVPINCADTSSDPGLYLTEDGNELKTEE